MSVVVEKKTSSLPISRLRCVSPVELKYQEGRKVDEIKRREQLRVSGTCRISPSVPGRSAD